MSRSVFSRSRRGSSAVEFGIALPILAIVMIACVDVGRYVAARNSLRAAVGEVVRAATTSTTMSGCTDPKTYALARVDLLEATLLNICVVRAADSITVSADYTFTFSVLNFGTAPRTLRATVTSPL
ncbi:TadE/TadG family type IV pilus assembly protein [Falsiroseomonas oryzae]|uniref:TadE/TadG family type IV pilus assembly protein n=1 Tax=Falsiroseomonas oryzae TaxID=2766473 RepID=UPI0022EB8909|nr:TadE/TadG family type IV pilus assembly protein [Roseomonas sp. MO-31]